MAPTRNRSWGRSFRSLNQSILNAGPAAMASYSLIGSILALTGLGYAIDAWRGTFPWFLVGGLVLGLVVGFYQLARTLWRR